MTIQEMIARQQAIVSGARAAGRDSKRRAFASGAGPRIVVADRKPMVSLARIHRGAARGPMTNGRS